MRKDINVDLWNKFNEMMGERGFRVLVHDDDSLGRGSIAVKGDKFAPVINLHVWGGPVNTDVISIHVQDRNGHFSLDGPTAAIYSLTDTGDSEKNLRLFTMMVEDCLEKFGSYSKENRLDFVFNGLTVDRKTYNESLLERGSDLNEIIKAADEVKNKQGTVKTIKENDIERE